VRWFSSVVDMLKAQGILPQSPSTSPGSGSPGPSVKVEERKNKGKGVKREREDDGVIEIVSDEDLDSLQVLRATHPRLSDS
jgi:hypothetical protein